MDEGLLGGSLVGMTDMSVNNEAVCLLVLRGKSM